MDMIVICGAAIMTGTTIIVKMVAFLYKIPLGSMRLLGDEGFAHFTVAYKDNTAPGTASVVISGKGNCSGTVTKSFQIKKTASDAVSNAILALKSADMITLADKAAVAAAR